MKKFNLRKQASANDYVIHDKMLSKNRDEMNLSSEKQGVPSKNINLSLPTKDKDNTVPMNVQLEAERKNETSVSITEASMDDKQADFNSKDKKQVMDINVKTEEYNQKNLDAFKRAEDSSKKDTEFWDKWVGVQLEGSGQPTKVDNNIPTSTSQLPNHPDRFKGKEVEKMVMASMKDADAMLFHIYAAAAQEGRDLNEDEKQQVVDINAGKTRLMAQMVNPIRRSLEYGADPVIKEESGKAGVYESDGTKIDEFKSCEEAKANYPEGDLESA